MDKKEKRRRDAAFYTALAVCLTAAGVGTWQLLKPPAAQNAQSGTAAVSPAQLPAAPRMDAPAAQTPPVADGQADAQADAPQAVSGAAEVPAAPAAKDTEIKSDAPKPKADAPKPDASAPKSDAKADGGKTSDGGATTGKKSDGKKSDGKKSDSGKTSGGDAKPGGKTVRPVEGAVVTAYSMDKLLYNETMRDWRTHDGIDIAADAGAAVVAAKAGTVESVEADPIMGVTVTIRHEGAWETVYSSLADMAEAEAGDEVAAGQVIGYVGESAASEAALGPHLHFSARNGGAPADPEAFLS